MNNSHIIGIDLGKNSFHLVGHDHAGNQLFKKKLTRQKLLEFLSCHAAGLIGLLESVLNLVIQPS